MARYLIRVANTRGYDRHQVAKVAKEFQEMTDVYGVSLKNFRISEYAVEFDLFSERPESKVKALQKISSEIGGILNDRDLGKAEELRGKEEVVAEAVGLFNGQRYWECHEILESIWRIECDEAEKGIQQGIILAASSLVHAQKDEDAVCLGMVSRAIVKLEAWTHGRYYSVNVVSLKRDMKNMLKTKRISFPRI